MDIQTSVKSDSPCRVVQFGEGNFLRAFADYIFYEADRSGLFRNTVTIVKPIRQGSVEDFRTQNCNYTVIESGSVNGTESGKSFLVNNISAVIDPYEDFAGFMALADHPDVRFIVSNTTEAGIVYDPGDRMERGLAESFPGKAVQFLYRRFTTFNGDPDKGLIFLPCELIDNNGEKLKAIIEKFIDRDSLGTAFRNWVADSCIFCSTLVDRIVVGRPIDPVKYYEAIGYTDRLLTVCEPFLLWVISSDKDIRNELPIDRLGLDIIFTDDLTPYRERKVRILNGVHTSITPAALAMGYEYVHEAVSDPVLSGFITGLLHQEILISIHLPRPVLESYSASVLERFSNPGLNHRLSSISLNTVSKWRSRVLPSLMDYIALKQALPNGLVFTFAAMTVFYINGSACRELFFDAPSAQTATISDVAPVSAFFAAAAARRSSGDTYTFHNFITDFASDPAFWGQDLSGIRGFVDKAEEYAIRIIEAGTRKAMEGIYGDHQNF
ncbi:MAG: tagaturonate reductase [Saccharofermentanales bacterium]